MNSLEWRTKKLEETIFGLSGATAVNQLNRNTILKQLEPVGELYANSPKEAYARFRQLQDSSKPIFEDKNESTKIDLVLAYQDDLVAHMKDLELVCNKADKVLDPTRWPDSGEFKAKLEELSELTASQFSESTKLDGKVEQLIGIYNDIINSFRGNMKRWNDILEVHEKQAAEKPIVSD